MSINSVTLTGRLGQDCDLKTTASGMSIASFSICVNDRVKNPHTQEWEDYANWIDCKLFGKRAESLSAYLVRGQLVGIDGRLRWSTWEKDGQKRSKVEVIVNDLELLGGTKSGGDSQPETYQFTQPAQPAQPTQEAVSDDIPF